MDTQAGFDVVNALTLLDNNMFLTDQKVIHTLQLSDLALTQISLVQVTGTS